MPRDRSPRIDVSDEEEARIQAGIARDPDNPELTDEQLARMRPGHEVLPPTLVAALKRRPGQRGPGKRPAKEPVTIRLDPAALAAWRETGPGWQSRIGELVSREAPKAKRRA